MRPQPYRQLRNAKSSILPRGRAHQLLCQYKMFSPENTNTSNIRQTEKVVFVYLGICLSIITMNEKGGLKESEDTSVRFEGRGKGWRMMELYHKLRM